MLTYGGGLRPRGINPLQQGNDWNELSSALFSRLFHIDERGEVQPDLVERYALSDDALSYTFHLRDARWHDGQRFTADDVQFTIEKIFQASPEMAANLSMLADSHARSHHVWIARLKDAAPSFVSALSDVPILPKHILRDADFNGDTLDRSPIGTGAYKLADAAQTHNSEWTLQAHETYHFGKPRVPALKIVIVPDDDERAQRMAAGEFDLCQVKAQHINTLRQAGLNVYRFRSGAWRGMPQNLRRPMLQDKRVRQAISAAINRDVIIEGALLGLGTPAYLPISPSSWVYDESLVHKGRDPGRARRLLSEAGFVPDHDGMLHKDGEPFVYRIGIWKDELFRHTAGGLVQRQLGELGIRVELDLVDNAGYLKIGDDPGTTHDTIIGGWSGLLDPDMSLSKKFHSHGSQNAFMQYHNPEVDRLLEVARATREHAARKVIYTDVLKMLLDDMPWIPVAYPEYVFAARPQLHGLREGMTVDSWYHFTRRAWQWSLGEAL